VESARAAGELAADDEQVELPSDREEDAHAAAVQIALALYDSRRRLRDMIEGTEPDSAAGRMYRTEYPRALEAAGLEDVELVDAFPVLTGNFGYTRGDQEPGSGRLMPFKDAKG